MISALVSGPYWVRTNTNGTHDVCGRNAKVVMSYSANQVSFADAHCRLLQKGFVKSQKALSDAAPALLEACRQVAASSMRNAAYDACVAAIAKATAAEIATLAPQGDVQ